MRRTARLFFEALPLLALGWWCVWSLLWAMLQLSEGNLTGAAGSGCWCVLTLAAIISVLQLMRRATPVDEIIRGARRDFEREQRKQ